MVILSQVQGHMSKNQHPCIVLALAKASLLKDLDTLKEQIQVSLKKDINPRDSERLNALLETTQSIMKEKSITTFLLTPISGLIPTKDQE